MKKSYLIGLLCIGALTGLFTYNIPKAQAQNDRRDHAVVILAGKQVYRNDGSGQQIGLVVSFVDASPNATKAILGESLSKCLAAYLNEGFSYQLLPSGDYLLIR